MTARASGGDLVDAHLDEFLATHLEELVAFRRHLHAHPELSYHERETTALVARRLQVAGLEPRVLSVGTGLVCDVAGTDGSTVVALRADIDALAMPDEKDVPYRSQVPGLAHACGHDVHTTVVLGCGLVLLRLTDAAPRLPATRLLFQPAEESVPGGALDVLADGGLDAVDWLFALHCDPKLEVGRVGVSPGVITAAADMLEVRVHGRGGHTARPQLTTDVVVGLGRLAVELPHRVRARDAALQVAFGAVRAGDAPNVIPASGVLKGTVRTPDRRAWSAAPAVVEAAITDLLAPGGVEHEVVYIQGPPPIDNDEQATELLDNGARRALADAAVTTTPPSSGGDDFSWYLDHVRGSYGRLGVRDPDAGEVGDLHATTFDVDERAIAVGIRVLTHAVLAAARTG